LSLPQVMFITGTDTGVGKTVATAALAAALSGAGRSVAVYKPTQAGLEEGAGDVDVVQRLSGVQSVHEGIRLRYPMAPVAAAARAGVELPSRTEHLGTIRSLSASHDVTLVEGAGGLLVALDGQGGTLAGLAASGDASLANSAFVVVCRATLGTLNHTALTLEALERRGLGAAGLIIGAWPSKPAEIELSNRRELALMATLLGAIPAGAGAMAPAAFQAAAPGWFAVAPLTL
jgi:dethiobiotin synthetase